MRGTVAGLGADCVEKELRAEHEAELARAARRAAGIGSLDGFRRYGSARTLYNFHRDNAGGVLMASDVQPGLRESATFDRHAIWEIQRAAREGIYDIRGGGAKRRVPHFDDLLFLGASMSRYPLEGYRERCATDVVLGARHARKPIELAIPITIAGMSFGALSAQAKEALGRGASEVGTSTTTGDGGMTEEERAALQDARLPGAALPLRHEPRRPAARRRDRGRRRPGRQARRRRHAARPEDLRSRRRDARPAAPASTSAAPAGIPTGPGPTTSRSRSSELREITDWEKPIYVKVGATRAYYDAALAVKAGADVIVLDGMQGGTAATQDVFIEHVGIPILAAIPPAVSALQELGMHRKVGLIVSGGIRSGADAAKALALGADAVSIGVGRADRARRQRAGARRGLRGDRQRRRLSTTTGTRDATRPASRRRTRRSRRASIRCSAGAAWPTTCAR